MNSPLDRFIANFDTPEKCEANSESVHALMEQINAGAPIPTVSANDIRQIWDATRQMNADRPPRPGFAIGLSVFAGYGVGCAAEPARFFAAQWRHTLLLDLIDRGVLSRWVHNGEPDAEVFEAAATFRSDLEDLVRAMFKAIAQNEAELAAHASEAVGPGSVTEKTMDAEQLAAEREAHIRNLKELVELRTQQLKESVARIERLVHLVKDALPALSQIKDPTVKKLVENCGLPIPGR